MARKRSQDTGTEIIFKVGVVVFLLGLVNPTVRDFFYALGTAIVWTLLFLVFLAVVFLGYRIIQRRRGASATNDPSVGHYVYTEPPAVRTVVPDAPRASSNVPTPAPTLNLPDQLRKIDWFQFEKIVGRVYEKQGFRVTRSGGANPDGGIDLIIEKDNQRTAIQCKHWRTRSVGVKTAREFLGALTDSGISKGVFIALNELTDDARQLASKHGIEVISEKSLIAMLDAAEIQKDRESLELLNDSRKYCPKCEALMTLRTAAKGPNAGSQFWGCTTYPKCRFTLQIE